MSVITLDNIGKKYKQYSSAWKRLADWVMPGPEHRHNEIWVLENVSLKVEAGEALGIIGQNGAGKSTLLKILTGTTRATCGTYTLSGRVSALLELGMGFHYEFTGRQNAVMGCQMLGLDNSTIFEKIPEIINFSELGAYFERPFRTYSSGMQVRLAFSVATCLRPEILIVDEALSVGDTYFQHKSMDRIRDFQKNGTTLLFVSHDPGAVKSLCNRAILLDNGVMVQDGSPEVILDYYNALLAVKEKNNKIRSIEGSAGKVETRSGNAAVSIDKVDLWDENNRTSRTLVSGHEVRIVCEIVYNDLVEDLTVGLLIRDRLGNDVFGTNSYHLGCQLPVGKIGVRYKFSFKLKLNLGSGSYSVSIALHKGISHIQENYDWWDNALVFQVVPASSYQFVGVASLPISMEKL